MMWVDAGIILLLLVGLGFCWKLSHRLEILKTIADRFMPGVSQLSQILQRVTSTITYLKEASDKSQVAVKSCIPEAQRVRDDLMLLIEHADRLSYRLDDLIVKADGIEKDLRQTFLACAQQVNDQELAVRQSKKTSSYVAQAEDPRDLFVQRVISKYSKDDTTNRTMQGMTEREVVKW